MKNPYKILYIWLALEWPEGTIFNCGEHSLNIKKGDAFLMNFGKEHEVYNGSKKIRSGIIITADFDNCLEWQKLVCKSYKKYGNPKLPKKKNLFFQTKIHFLKVKTNKLTQFILKKNMFSM